MIMRQKTKNEIVKAVIDALPKDQRAHRMIDLDQPFKLEPKPLIALRDSVIKTGLKDLLEGGYFSICKFERLIDLAKVYPPAGLLKTLRPLHCINWADMDPDTRAQAQQHIIACFIPVEVEADSEPDDPK